VGVRVPRSPLKYIEFCLPHKLKFKKPQLE